MITWNVDFVAETGLPSDSLIKRVTSRLKKKQVNLEHRIVATPTEKVLGAYELFSLPAWLLFDGDGALIQRFTGKFSIETDVRPEVEAEVAKRKKMQPKSP